MSQLSEWPRTVAAMSRALRAYERMDVHLATCLACDGRLACDAAAELQLRAREARYAALPDRLWTQEELGLGGRNWPATLLPGPLADA